MDIDWYQFKYIIANFIWISARVAGVIMSAPVFGNKLVPARVKISLVVTLSFLFFSNLEYKWAADIFSLASGILVFKEILIGLILGFIFQLCFHIFTMIGQMISMQCGLGFAVMNDPNTNISVAMISQFYLLFGILLFFAVDAHLLFIEYIYKSYKIFPMHPDNILYINFKELLKTGSWMFENSLKIALPIITSLLIINITFGIMTKAAPQLNIFSIGFPITMLLGIFFVWFTIADIQPHFIAVLDEAFSIFRYAAIKDHQ